MRTATPDIYDTNAIINTGSGPTDPTGTAANGGDIDFGSGAPNPYLPVSSAPTTTTTSGTSSGTTKTGTTKTGSTSTSTSSSTSTRHTSSSSGSSSSSTTIVRQKIITTILTPHPVRVRFKATNAGEPGVGGTPPLHFIAAAGITSHERRSHHPSAPHIAPHRRF